MQQFNYLFFQKFFIVIVDYKKYEENKKADKDIIWKAEEYFLFIIWILLIKIKILKKYFSGPIIIIFHKTWQVLQGLKALSVGIIYLILKKIIKFVIMKEETGKAKRISIISDTQSWNNIMKNWGIPTMECNNFYN